MEYTEKLGAGAHKKFMQKIYRLSRNFLQLYDFHTLIFVESDSW